MSAFLKNLPCSNGTWWQEPALTCLSQGHLLHIMVQIYSNPKCRLFLKIYHAVIGLSGKNSSYKKKDDEPLPNLTGAMRRTSREKVLICTQKRELESPL